jgi:NADPH-dependent curcumin reductase CurA
MNKPAEKIYGITNMREVFRRRITIRGFIWWDAELLVPYGQDFQGKMQKMVVDGSMRFRHNIYKGLDSVPTAILEMYTGHVLGKPSVKVCEP